MNQQLVNLFLDGLEKVSQLLPSSIEQLVQRFLDGLEKLFEKSQQLLDNLFSST